MAQEEYQIPIFLINGQLDSGKTRFISDTIAMGQFAEAKNKLLIVCEEGEEEYSEKLLKDNGVDMVVLEKEELTEAKLNELDKEYDPWIVIVEYNGMWDPALLMGTAKPRGWEIYQSITLIDATAFNLQWNNMRKKHITLVSLIGFLLGIISIGVSLGWLCYKLVLLIYPGIIMLIVNIKQISNEVVVLLGNATYEVYLWHFPLFYLLEAVVNEINISVNTYWIYMLIYVLIVWGFSLLLYKGVEVPLMAWIKERGNEN